ncbi:MAG TPA: isoprenylcysteine carboxylmethyltransferase family protein [Candidatus Udaeobacter sp.]|jgi:protein-S-isoprenylcysteine O-methyltransferase Ste14|nr:isoprenylcysteine carboxylmethyltransferase family protein [Candidatus Udaeobacter sp.]
MVTVFAALRTVCYMAGFILLFGWLALRVQPWDESLKIPLPAWSKVVGMVAVTLGVLIVSACAAVFVARGRGTPAIFDPPRKFVATGPYKFVRNPMYIGGSILLIGFGLYRQSLAILLYSVVIILLFHLYVIFIEEPGLESRFGKSYFAYKQSVNRWLPKFPDRAHAAF